MTQRLNKHDQKKSNRFSLPYRRGVGLMVINKAKKVFVGQRIDAKTDSWQMPQGGIKDDETVVEAGLRELREETNIVDVEIIMETKNWLYYDVPEFLVEKLWRGQYRGQKQKWLLMRFCSNDSTIDIQRGVAEFAKWKWLDLNKVPDIVVPFKRHLYSSVINEFRTTINNYIPVTHED